MSPPLLRLSGLEVISKTWHKVGELKQMPEILLNQGDIDKDSESIRGLECLGQSN